MTKSQALIAARMRHAAPKSARLTAEEYLVPGDPYRCQFLFERVREGRDGRTYRELVAHGATWAIALAMYERKREGS